MAAATTSMVVVAFVIPLGLAVQTIAANEALSDAEIQARSLAPAIATVHDPSVLAELVRSAAATSAGRLSVFMPDGQVVGETAAADANVALARTGRAFTSVGPGGANIFVPVVIPGSGTAVVEMSVPDSRLHRGVATAWAILAATGLGLVLLAVVVADRIARGIVLPTRALAVAARRVSQGELQTNVVPAGPAEITEVGRAFNLLVTRIGELLVAEREAAADLSHRLRTPLTALRINVDRLPSGSEADHLVADVDAIEQAVTDVIQELRRQSHEGISRVTDIVPAVRGRVTFWTSLANEEGRPCAVDIAPGSWKVALPQDEVETAVDVLLSNVFAHTPEKVPLRIVLEGAGSDQVRLVVEDDGPGFPPSMVARGQSGGGSTGLGLDIVRRAAESTGGSLSTSEGKNGGARVEVFFGVPDAGSPTHDASDPSGAERLPLSELRREPSPRSDVHSGRHR